MSQKIKSILSLGTDFANGIGERTLTVFAACGCYYVFMSLVPMMMVICCVLPYTPFNQNLVMGYINHYCAAQLADVIGRIVRAVYTSDSATLTVSILLTLIPLSAAMRALMRGINAAYHVKHKDNFIVFTFKALIYMFVLLGTLILSLVIMVYGNRILNLLRHYLPTSKVLVPLDFILSKGRYALVVIVLGLVFSVLYVLIPNRKVKLLHQIPGAIFTALLWMAFSKVFEIYVDISDKYGAYGFIGTIMVAMMWMYWCLFILLIGAYINSFIYSQLKNKEASKEEEVLEESSPAPAPQPTVKKSRIPSLPFRKKNEDILDQDDLWEEDMDDLADVVDKNEVMDSANVTDKNELMNSANVTDKNQLMNSANVTDKTEVMDSAETLDSTEETDSDTENTKKKFPIPRSILIGIIAALFITIVTAITLKIRKGRVPAVEVKTE